MSLRDLSVLDSEPRLGSQFCFNLYDGNKAVLLAASNHQEKLQWMEDIAEAAQVTYRKDTEPLYHAFMYSPIILLSSIYPFTQCLALLATII